MRLYILLIVFAVGSLYSQGRDTTGVVRKHIPVNDTARGSSAADTLAKADSLSKKKIIPRDTLKPVNQRALNDNSYFVNKTQIIKTNYKTVHDIAGSYPINFVKDFGFAVHPNDLYLNGAGVNSSAYLLDGIDLNNDYSWFNPLYLQTENIDSVEIINASRSFLYGINNSSAAMNILTKNRVERAPFTRIRYQEGPFKEGTLDAQYSSIVFRKFVLSFDITTKKVEDVVRKWNSAVWLGNLKLKYFPTEKLNLVASYDYRDYKLSLTGGIDVAALDTLPKAADKTLKDYVYDSNLGILNDNVSYNKERMHNINLRAISSYIENGYTELAFYYRSSLDEYRQNEQKDSTIINKVPYCVADVRSKILGAKLRQSYKLDLLNFDGSAEYSAVKYDTNRVVLANWKTSYALSGRLSTIVFGGAAEVSAFGKIAGSLGCSLPGMGADITINLNENISLYGGVSSFSSLRNSSYSDSSIVSFYLGYPGRCDKITTNIIEGGIKYSSSLLSLNARAVYRREDSKYDVFGAGITASLSLWQLLIENNTSYYDKPLTENINYSNYTGSAYFLTPDIMPRIQITTGFYYKDILFDSNLDLKTGFSTRFMNFKQQPGVKYYGLFSQNVFTFNFELTGEIQKTAIIYFVWENPLDVKYFIVPFYPMQGKAIRIGVAWNFLN